MRFDRSYNTKRLLSGVVVRSGHQDNNHSSHINQPPPPPPASYFRGRVDGAVWSGLSSMILQSCTLTISSPTRLYICVLVYLFTRHSRACTCKAVYTEVGTAALVTSMMAIQMRALIITTRFDAVC